MLSLDKILEQSVGQLMALSANSSQQILNTSSTGHQSVVQNLFTSGTVINSDLVKSAVVNPDTLAEVVSAASGYNTAQKLNMPPASPDMSLAYYQQLKALANRSDA